MGWILSWARSERACWALGPRCCLGRPEEESFQGEGVTSCLLGWAGERCLVWSRAGPHSGSGAGRELERTARDRGDTENPVVFPLPSPRPRTL